MSNGTHLNYLALNQSVLCKPLVFGVGPAEGDAVDPILSPGGLKVYLNGKHDLSPVMGDDFKLEEVYGIGEMRHPYAMDGMPGMSGVITYVFGHSEKYYVIVVELKLDEDSNGESDPAVDLLAAIKKSEIPESFQVGENEVYLLSQEMVSCHLDRMIGYYDSYEEFIAADFEFNEEEVLMGMVKYYFDQRKSNTTGE